MSVLNKQAQFLVSQSQPLRVKLAEKRNQSQCLRIEMDLVSDFVSSMVIFLCVCMTLQRFVLTVT